MRTHGLILAAGNSSRLGTHKQNIQFNQTTLLAMIENALALCCQQVTVVLGYNHQDITTQPSSYRVINSQWHKGMGSSIKAGLTNIEQSTDALLIALCDQPYIKPIYYQHLVELAHQSPNMIIASKYHDSIGVPAIFPINFLEHLLATPDSHGAKSVINKHPNDVVAVDCPEGSFDIDNEDDLKQLLVRQQTTE